MHEGGREMSRLHWPPRPTLPGLALVQPQAAEPEHLLNPLKLGLSRGAGAGRDWLGLWYVKVGSSAFYFLCREVFLAASFLKLFFPLAIIAFTSPLKFFCLIFLMAARRLCRIFPGGSDGKTSAYNAGDLGLIPGLGRTPGEGNGNPLQYSCLGIPVDREACRATVQGVAKSHTQLSD